MSKHSLRQFALTGASAILLASLMACGGSSDDAPARTTADLPPITLSAANVELAKAVGAALKDKSISLTESVELAGGAKANIPPSTLTFTALPAGAPANAITGVTLKNEFYEATGFAMPGSLNFYFNSVIWLGNPVPTIWSPTYNSVWDFQPLTPPSFLFSSFQVDFQTLDLFPGTQIIGFTASFNGYQIVSQITGFVGPYGTSSNTISFGPSTSIEVPNSAPPGATGATGGGN